MPLMTVANLIDQLREMPPGCFVGVEAADGRLTTDLLPPKVETAWLSLTGDNQDDEAFFDEFQIADEAELRLVALRPGRSPGDQAASNDA